MSKTLHTLTRRALLPFALPAAAAGLQGKQALNAESRDLRRQTAGDTPIIENSHAVPLTEIADVSGVDHHLLPIFKKSAKKVQAKKSSIKKAYQKSPTHLKSEGWGTDRRKIRPAFYFSV